MSIPSVAIIGGGYSGTAVLAHLVRGAHGPLRIEWFDAQGEFGPGLAYSTRHLCHRLNVRAANMSAFADIPDDFCRWLEEESARDPQGELAAGGYGPGDFVPRYFYGLYLRDVAERALQEAADKGVEVNRHAHSVERASRAEQDGRPVIALEVEGGEQFICDYAVLATGNVKSALVTSPEGGQQGMPVVIADVWAAIGDEETMARIRALPETATILVVGTGLTMVDIVMTLESSGFKGKIIAASRRGLLPRVHEVFRPYPGWTWGENPASAPRTALGLLRGMRAQVRTAQAEGYDWRAVVDSLRGVTTDLWRGLDLNQKRRFMRRLMPYWGVHRHRMAPEIHETLQAMIQSGKLRIMAGRFEPGANGDMAVRGSGGRVPIRPAMVFTCTGIEYDVSLGGGLLRAMQEAGLITSHPLRMGVQVDAQETAAGAAEGLIYPIGNLLIGEHLECTAVPDLRVRAGKIARDICARFSAS